MKSKKLNQISLYPRLQDLPYGTVIEYKKKRYYKCQGLEGDILMAEENGGVWVFIKGTYKQKEDGVDWKKFLVLYRPPEKKD